MADKVEFNRADLDDVMRFMAKLEDYRDQISKLERAIQTDVLNEHIFTLFDYIPMKKLYMSNNKENSGLKINKMTLLGKKEAQQHAEEMEMANNEEKWMEDCMKKAEIDGPVREYIRSFGQRNSSIPYSSKEQSGINVINDFLSGNKSAASLTEAEIQCISAYLTEIDENTKSGLLHFLNVISGHTVEWYNALNISEEELPEYDAARMEYAKKSYMIFNTANKRTLEGRSAVVQAKRKAASLQRNIKAVTDSYLYKKAHDMKISNEEKKDEVTYRNKLNEDYRKPLSEMTKKYKGDDVIIEKDNDDEEGYLMDQLNLILKQFEDSGKKSSKNSDLSGKIYQDVWSLAKSAKEGRIDRITTSELKRIQANAFKYLAYKNGSDYNHRSFKKIAGAYNLAKLCSYMGGKLENRPKMVTKISRGKIAEILSTNQGILNKPENQAQKVTYTNSLKNCIKQRQHEQKMQLAM